MTKILTVECSPGGNASWSRKATNALRERLAQKYPGATFTERDLDKTPVPHLTGLQLGAMFTPPDAQTADQKNHLSLSNSLVQELVSHDVFVVSFPFWNYSIPSVLKAWIDHIVRAGITFKYTEKGAQGLLPPKPYYPVVASGGFYTEPPMSSLDHGAKYLIDVFGLLGLKHEATIRVEGTAMGEAIAKQSFEGVLKQISTL
jgi:FMN-dependent NADH-azoreductase